MLLGSVSATTHLIRGKLMAEIIYMRDALFAGKDESVLSIYSRLLEILHTLGPFQEELKKTSTHLVRTVGFASVHPRKTYLILNLRTITL